MPRPVRPFHWNSYKTSDKEEDKRLFSGFFHEMAPWYIVALKIVMGVFLVPVRILLVLIILAPCALLSTLLKPKRHNHSLFYKPRMKMFAIITHLCARLVSLVMGVVVVKEGNNMPFYNGHKTFLMMNHSSFVDIIIATSATKCAYICKRGIANIPMVGTLSESIGCLYVERTSPESRREASEAVSRRAHDNTQPRLCIFPEGTTSSGSQLLRFKYGGFKPGLPVQPAVIKYITPFGKVSWDIQSGLICILSLLASPFVIAKIKFLPVYVPNDEERNKPELYANNVRKLMAEELGVPTDYPFGLEDKFIYRGYYRSNLTYEKMKQLIQDSYGPEVFKWSGVKHPKED